ncbi:MAG: Sapep family Mn(2+)-dependent dipeptidase, partial [Armatimonadetes bacterium]|nr:Sapep family Mn(2+)-dependent dipeptidase [Armatimonadota bacterium]
RMVEVRRWLAEHHGELVRDTVAMLRIASLQDDPAPGAPFGPNVRAALDLALELSGQRGLRTKDLDGYAGYAEAGEGEPLVLSLGHLDVVPPGNGWTFDPFGAEVRDGWIYARGATDDKGPTMASLYALSALAETCGPLPARVRVVFGCNEESGMQCVKHYVRTEEAPTHGISPDAGWPLAHAEKGIANFVVSFNAPRKGFDLLDIEGGDRPNMVIDRCEAKVRVDRSVRAEVDGNLAKAWDRNVEWEWDGDLLSVVARGKAAHAAHPFAGDSAAVRLFRFLAEVAPESAREEYSKALQTGHLSGVGLGIHGSDEPSGDLTCNLGIVSCDGARVSLWFNVRYPVTWNGEQVRERVLRRIERYGSDWSLDRFDDSPPLYFPLDHPMVAALREVVREELGIEDPPIVMGGGTYARVVPNTVSVGASLPGDGAAHESDERIHTDHLLKLAEVYAHMLLRLATLAGSGA